MILFLFYFFFYFFLGLQSELYKSAKKNEILRQSINTDNLKLKKDYDILLIEKNKSNEALESIKITNESMESELSKFKYQNTINETLFNEKLNFYLVEISKIKSDMKSQQNKSITADLVRKEEILILRKDKDKLIEINEEIKSKVNLLELKIIENTAAHEAETERIIALHDSQAQIAAAQLRISFSTDKRKFKEELSNLNKKLNLSEKQTDEYKNINYDLQNKIKELGNVSSIGEYLQEEKIIQFLKLRNIYDSTIHNNGNLAKTGSWFDLLSTQSESEISKIIILKKCLKRFGDKLDGDENHLLQSVGIEL